MSDSLQHLNMEIKSQKTFLHHTNSVDDVKFHPTDETRFVSASHDREICVWDITQNKPITLILAQDEGVWSFDIGMDGKSVVSTGPSGKIYHTDLSSGKVERIQKADLNKGYSIRFLNNSTDFIIAGQNGRIEKYGFDDLKVKCSAKMDDMIVYDWKQLENENEILACTSNGSFFHFDLNLQKKNTFEVSKHEIRTFEVIDGHVYTGFQNGDLKIFKFDSVRGKLELEKELKGHKADIVSMTYDEKNRILVTGSKDSSIFGWNFDKKTCLHNLVGHKDLISALSINRTRNILVSASWDQTLRSYKMEDIFN